MGFIRPTENNSTGGGTPIVPILPSDTVVMIDVEDNQLQLVGNEYQKCYPEGEVQVLFPTIDKKITIHLFVLEAQEGTILNFPSCSWQTEPPTIEVDKTYEFVFTFVGEWLGRCVVYE